jgi:DNA-binding CsgD family transcriptional regulator
MDAKPEYCTRPELDSCYVCSLVSYGRDCYNNNIRDARRLVLIDAGLSPQEADVIASVEAGERPSDVAKRLGVSRQAISDAIRRGKIKMSQVP